MWPRKLATCLPTNPSHGNKCPSAPTVCGLPRWLSDAEATGGAGLIPGSGRFAGGGHSNRFHYSCLENPMDRGAWQATVHRITESDTHLLCARHCT